MKFRILRQNILKTGTFFKTEVKTHTAPNHELSTVGFTLKVSTHLTVEDFSKTLKIDVFLSWAYYYQHHPSIYLLQVFDHNWLYWILMPCRENGLRHTGP